MKVLTTTLALIAIAAVGLNAQERFGKMDKNKDGSLSKEEMTPKKKKAP
jgi:hypothetical protein